MCPSSGMRALNYPNDILCVHSLATTTTTDNATMLSATRRQRFVSPGRHFISVWAILHTYSTRQFYLWQSTTRCRKIVHTQSKAEGAAAGRENNERIKNIRRNRNKLNEKNGAFYCTRIEYIETYACLHFDHSTVICLYLHLDDHHSLHSI